MDRGVAVTDGSSHYGKRRPYFFFFFFLAGRIARIAFSGYSPYRSGKAAGILRGRGRSGSRIGMGPEEVGRVVQPRPAGTAPPFGDQEVPRFLPRGFTVTVVMGLPLFGSRRSGLTCRNFDVGILG